MLNEIKRELAANDVSIVVRTREGSVLVHIDRDNLEKARSIRGRWGLFKMGSGKVSVRAGKEDGQVFLHKLLFDIPAGSRLEYINDNSLDLRRENLQLVDRSGNVTALLSPDVAVTRSPGVKFHKASQRWTARIYWEGVRYSLGYFKEQQDAEREAAIFRAEGPHSPKLKRNQPKGDE